MRKINAGSHGKPCANHVRLLALESEEESCGIIAPLRSYIIYGRVAWTSTYRLRLLRRTRTLIRHSLLINSDNESEIPPAKKR